MADKPQPLHLCHVMKPELIVNRLHIFLHSIALLSLFYYRATSLYQIIQTKETPLIPYLFICLSEVILTFQWILDHAYRWRPVTRTVYPERLPEDDKFPSIDILICTADPSKEPSLSVMNTVLSAMTLDYPPDKLAVYLHDDGGSFVTLQAMRETWRFSKFWVPFCRKYGVKPSCPEAYFKNGDDKFSGNDFVHEKKRIKEKYEEFKGILEKNSVNASSSVSRDHEPVIEMMTDGDGNGDESIQQDAPLLFYVAREKRPSRPHHFKAGALNALVRISAIISNAPIILVLDCDHYCNDPTAARQALCYYFDPEISPKLAFVQFPQKFHNISKHDLYDGRLYYYWRKWLGMDGIAGPSISGCNLFLKREALYRNKYIKNDDINKLKKYFGPSNELIKSIYKNHKPDLARDGKLSAAVGKEVQLLASCDYDNQSEWGKEVGFVYFSVVEDNITSLMLHCQGLVSVWVDPPRPCFLGSCPTNLSDMLVQQTRWGLGLMQISLSKSCALWYGLGKISFLQSMCYASGTFDPLFTVPFYILGLVPQICLLHGVSLYPKVSDPFFLVFAFIFLSSQLKHVQEVMFYGDSFMTSLYELRVWMMKSASCYLYATLGAVMEKFGMHEAHFTLTNKVYDEEETERYQKGIYDFQASPFLIAPMCSLYILNAIAFIIGIVKGKGMNEMFVQGFIPLFGMVVNYHVFEGMVIRNDRARVAPFVTLVSVAIAASVLCFGYILFSFIEWI